MNNVHMCIVYVLNFVGYWLTPNNSHLLYTMRMSIYVFFYFKTLSFRRYFKPDQLGDLKNRFCREVHFLPNLDNEGWMKGWFCCVALSFTEIFKSGKRAQVSKYVTYFVQLTSFVQATLAHQFLLKALFRHIRT